MMKDKMEETLLLQDCIGKIVKKNDLVNGMSWILVTDVQKMSDFSPEQLKGILIKKISGIDTTPIGTTTFCLVSEIAKIIPVFKYEGRTQTQAELIENEILRMIGDGMKNKKEIFDYIVEKHNVPRPTVRRTAMDLRKKYHRVFKILNKDVPKHAGGRKKKTDETSQVVSEE